MTGSTGQGGYESRYRMIATDLKAIKTINAEDAFESYSLAA